MWVRFVLYGLGGWWACAIIRSPGFTMVELLAGWLIAKVSGRCSRDYVVAGKRFAISPYLRWDFFIVWAAIGLAFEPEHDFGSRSPRQLRALQDIHNAFTSPTVRLKVVYSQTK